MRNDTLEKLKPAGAGLLTFLVGWPVLAHFVIWVMQGLGVACDTEGRGFIGLIVGFLVAFGAIAVGAAVSP